MLLTEPLRQIFLYVFRNVAYHHVTIYGTRRHAPKYVSIHREVLHPQLKVLLLPTEFGNRLLHTARFAGTNFSPIDIYASTHTTPGQAYCLTSNTRRKITSRRSFCDLSPRNSALEIAQRLNVAILGRSRVDLDILSCSPPASSRDWPGHPSRTTRPLESPRHSAGCFLEQYVVRVIS